MLLSWFINPLDLYLPTIFMALAAEEYESIFRSLDVVVITFLGTTLQMSAARRPASFLASSRQQAAIAC